MRSIALLAVTALVAAGCLGTGTDDDQAPWAPLGLAEIEALLSQPIYSAIERSEHVVEGAGGTQIWMDVYRPTDADGPVPVILVKTPYQILTLDPTGESPYSAFLVDYFAPRGYAVAFSDVRGNNNSGGCIDQSGPDQWVDGYNVVEYLGAQPWSNGRVGMYGASYDGETQFSTALLNPPSLKTIIPTASVSNQYEYSFYDGVPYGLGAIPTNAAYLGISLAPGTHPNAVTTYPERLLCMPENFANAADFSGDHTEYWLDRDYRIGADNITASVLHIHGLQDWNVKPNHVDPLFNDITSEKRAIFGQWGHAYPNRDDWTFIAHRWFDHFLYEIDTGILQDLPPVLIQNTEGDWHGIDAFPPTDLAWQTLHLGLDGALAAEPGADGTLAIQDRLQQAGGFPLPGVQELQQQLEAHPDRLVFESAALEADLNLTGRPLVQLIVSTDATSTHWAVLLERVREDGSASWINRGYLDTRHLEGMEQPSDLTPGESYTATVRMFPQDDVVMAGERLRLTISNADDWIEQDDTAATSHITVGIEGSRLLLPVLAEPGTPFEHERLRSGL